MIVFTDGMISDVGQLGAVLSKLGQSHAVQAD